MFFASMEHGAIVNLDYLVTVNLNEPTATIDIVLTDQCTPNRIALDCKDMEHATTLFNEIKNALPEVTLSTLGITKKRALKTSDNTG